MSKAGIKGIETLTGELPQAVTRLDKAKQVLADTKNASEVAKECVLEIMQFRVYRGAWKGYSKGTILVEITFSKCSNNERLVKPYKEIRNNSKAFLDDLSDFVILINASIESIMECIEDVYSASMTEFKDDVFEGKAEALRYYNDIVVNIENNSEEFISLKDCKFDKEKHKGYFIDQNTLVVTKKFLNRDVFKREDITGELVDISPNKKGEVFEVFKQMGLIICRYSTRKDVDVYFTADKTGDKEYAYIFKIDRTVLSKEVA